jgi:hypothetical protein
MRFSRIAPADPQAVAARLWWLRPVPLILFIIIPLYLSFLTFGYENVVPRRYLPSENYLWGICLLLALALGAGLGAGSEPALRGRIDPRMQRPPIYVSDGITASLLALTLMAYVVWFGSLVFDPGTIVKVWTGELDHVRYVIKTVPGVTTLTQCGAAYLVLTAIRQFGGGAGPRGVALWEHVGVLIVFLLAALRAFLWAERLAVLEVTIVYGVAVAAFYRFRTVMGWRLAAAAPFIGPVIVYVLFTATETFRSWRFYKNYYDSIWQFAFERLMTYYAVATNSGLGLLAESRNWPQYTGRYALEWAYEMPVLGPLLIEAFGDVSQNFTYFLEHQGRPEFNNPSGIFPVVFDIGYFGSAVYFVLAGVVVGLARRGWVRRSPFGLLFFPFCVLFVLELLRFNYLASARFFPIAASLLVALFLIQPAAHAVRRYAPRARGLPQQPTGSAQRAGPIPTDFREGPI